MGKEEDRYGEAAKADQREQARVDAAKESADLARRVAEQKKK